MYIRLLIFFGFPLSCFAAPLTLEEFQRLIVQTHPAFASEKLDIAVAEKKRDAAKGGEDWMLSSSPFYRTEEPVASSTFSPTEAQRFGADLGLSRAIWETGGRIGLSVNYDYTDQKIPAIEIPGLPSGMGLVTAQPTFHRHAAIISYLHPLLKNRNGNQDRLVYDLRDLDVQLLELQTLENREELLLQMSSKYLDWVNLFEQVRISRQREALSLDQFEETERRRDQNLVDEVDVLRAENGVQVARQRTVLTHARALAVLRELEILIGLEADPTREPGFGLYESREHPVVEASWYASARPMRALDVLRDQVRRRLLSLEDGEEAQLDLALSGGLVSGDDTYGDSTRFNHPEAQIGLQFSVPLGGRTVKREAEAALLELQKVRKQEEYVELQLKAALENVQIQLGELEKVLELNRKQMTAANKQTVEELKAYDQGRSPLTFVIQSRDGEAQAANLYAENALQYQKLLLNYLALTDTLLSE
ncbi:MAG: outer membrane protein TolC [Kiritimatiellia bacterium]|jgi:outer membrane protein TolC